MSNLSPQRKKVVVLCASLACMAGVGPVLLQKHPALLLAWTAILIVAVAYAIAEFVKLKRSDQ
jgi:hypothetical protein